MAVSYNRLWKLLIDLNMGKSQLRKAAALAPNTLTKMRKEELVSMAVLCRICDTLNVGLDQIVEYAADEDAVPGQSLLLVERRNAL